MEQIDIYTGVHKGQRRKFFDILAEAGVMRYDDQDSMNRLGQELKALREHMFLHASLEEKYIHPLLSERVPGGARKLEEDHRAMHQQFDDIVRHLDWIRENATDSDMRGRLLLEFYRSWSRFMSFYFTHVNDEEENAQPMLWKVCTAEEIGKAHKRMIESQSLQELRYDLQIMLRAVNVHERPEIFYAAREVLPRDAYEALQWTAKEILNASDWKSLSEKIGSELPSGANSPAGSLTLNPRSASMAGPVEVIKAYDLPPGQLKEAEVGGQKILIANVSGTYYAIGNVCKHRGCLLSEGRISGTSVVCPCHGSTYNLIDGSIVRGPTEEPEPAYSVMVDEERVLIDVSAQ